MIAFRFNYSARTLLIDPSSLIPRGICPLGLTGADLSDVESRHLGKVRLRTDVESCDVRKRHAEC